MKQYLLLAGLFLLCAAMNLVNVFRTGNGFGFVFGGVWIAASFVCYLKYRKDQKKDAEEEQA